MGTLEHGAAAGEDDDQGIWVEDGSGLRLLFRASSASGSLTGQPRASQAGLAFVTALGAERTLWISRQLAESEIVIHSGDPLPGQPGAVPIGPFSLVHLDDAGATC